MSEETWYEAKTSAIDKGMDLFYLEKGETLEEFLQGKLPADMSFYIGATSSHFEWQGKDILNFLSSNITM